MICQGCKVWQENLRLKSEVEALRGEKTALEIELGKLRKKLALYENIRPITKSRKRERRKITGNPSRFPGKPKGSRGATGKIPDANVVVPPVGKVQELRGAARPARGGRPPCG